MFVQFHSLAVGFRKMNLVIYFGLLFVLLCFSLQQFTFGYEDDESNFIDVEVDASSGFQRVGSRQRDDKVSVVFENKYLNESVDLFWLDDGGQEYLITNILSDGSAVVDTTHYHRFLGRGKDSLQITFPRLVSYSTITHSNFSLLLITFSLDYYCTR